MSTTSSSRRLPQLNCSISYAIERLNHVDLTKMIPFFSNLVPDPYLEGRYRFRRFSQFEVTDQTLRQLPHTPFLQSKNYNPLLGDVTREYEELDKDLIALVDFQNLIFEFFDFCIPCGSTQTVGVHQIRITTSPLELGNPAPEGIHQDGVELVGIFCVQRFQISGGESELYSTPTAPPLFTKVLNPGELLVVNDQALYHYATPIYPSRIDIGNRDIFVLTSPAMPAPS